MKILKAAQNKGQEYISRASQYGKAHPEEVKTLGVMMASGMVGVVAVTVVTKGVLLVATTLASPSISIAAGAFGGGLLGWQYMQAGATEKRDVAYFAKK